MSLLEVSDAFCYICRGILIEPVTLPCHHVFCFSCFEQSMQETSYSCPLCRKRISNWVRSVKKSNKLVNAELWKRIKEQFKEQVNLKLNGEDDGLDLHMQKEYPILSSMSNPGEVAQEFTKLLNDFRKERERLRQAEELASKELIVKLKEEEEKELQTIQNDNILRISEDEKLAMKIQEEINKETPSTSQQQSQPDRRTLRKSKDVAVKVSPKGSLDFYLRGCSESEKKKVESPSPSERTSDDRSTSTESIDSIRLETNHFKPIKKVKRTPPKRYPEGREREVSLTKVTPLKLTFNSLSPSSSGRTVIEGMKIHSTHSAFVDANVSSTDSPDSFESPSKRLRFSSDEDSGVLKDITLGENNDSNSSSLEESGKKKGPKKSIQDNFIIPTKVTKYGFETRDDENDRFDTQDYLDPDPSIEEKIIEEQRRIEKIILQEKEDRELALKLSREWESEFKTKPQTRSMLAAAAAVRKKKTLTGKKPQAQQTLMESIAGRNKK